MPVTDMSDFASLRWRLRPLGDMTDLFPMGLAILASLIIALNFFVQQHGLKTTDPVIGAFLSVLSMAVMFWVFAPVSGIQTAWFFHPSTLYFIIAGLTFPAIAQYIQIASIRNVGPTLTAAIGSMMPLFAAVPAVLFLGEDFGFALALGFTLMMSGVVVAALSGGQVSRNFPLWMLLLPLVASACRGLVQPLIKIGLQDIPSPYFVTLVAGNVSTLVMLVIVMATGKAVLLTRPTSGFLWFILVGMINGTSLLLINSSIALGDITRVAPFISTAPLWVLFLGWAVFKNEKLGLKHLMVAILVVVGSILVVTR